VLNTNYFVARGTADLTATADGIVVSNRGTGEHDNNNGLSIDIVGLRALAGSAVEIVITGTATTATRMDFQGLDGISSAVTDGGFTLTVPGALGVVLPEWASSNYPFIATQSRTDGNHGDYTITKITVGGVDIYPFLFPTTPQASPSPSPSQEPSPSPSPTPVAPPIWFAPGFDIPSVSIPFSNNASQPTVNRTATATGGVTVNVRVTGDSAAIQLTAALVNGMAEGNDAAVSFDLSGLNVTSATIPRFALRSFAEAGKSVEIKLPEGTLSLNSEAAKAIGSLAHTVSVRFRINTVPQNRIPAALLAVMPRGATIHQAAIAAGSRSVRTLENGAISVTISAPASANVWGVAPGARLVAMNAQVTGGNATFETRTLGLFVVGVR